MRRSIEFSMTVTDSSHHVHKVTAVSKREYATTLVLDDGNAITVEDHDIETKDMVEVHGSKGTDYYITITKE